MTAGSERQANHRTSRAARSALVKQCIYCAAVPCSLHLLNCAPAAVYASTAQYAVQPTLRAGSSRVDGGC